MVTDTQRIPSSQEPPQSARVVMVLLFAVFMFYLSLYVNRFYVPESDFFDYRAKAIELRSLHWPDNFKRPPLYSIAVAAFSVPISGLNRELYSAELIGILAALGSLLLLYRIAHHFLQQHGFWIAWLWALHPTTLRMAIKPKPEILVTFLILWAFYEFLKKERRCYFIAFLATMVRYEGALVIAAFFVADFLFQRKRLRTLLIAFSSGLFILLWTLLQSGGEDGANYSNYFNAYRPNLAFLVTFWEGVLRFVPPALFKPTVLLSLLLILAGAVQLWGGHRRELIGLGLFGLGFIAMHIVWPFSNLDYIVIVNWAALLFIVSGGITIARKSLATSALLKGLFASKRFMTLFPFISATLVLLIALLLALKKFSYPQFRPNGYLMALFLIPAVLHVLRSVRWLPAKWGFANAMLAILLPLTFYNNSRATADLHDIQYSKAEYRLVGEWYRRHHVPGFNLAVDQPVIVGYFARIHENHFIRLVDLPDSAPEELSLWLRQNKVQYIAWMSTHRVYESKDAWYSWKRDHRGWHTVSFLQEAKDHPGFQYLETLKAGARYANLFQVNPPHRNDHSIE